MRSLRIICPNGHLGFAPIRVESFRLGVAERPDYIAADSGSDDVGPVPLGTDTSTSPLSWQTHDLEHMLLASRELGVPMIIGSSGDTGSNSRVDLYVKIIKELAAKHRMPQFKLGYFYSEVDKEDLRRRMRAGETVAGLEGYEALSESELDATARIVAMAGVPAGDGGSGPMADPGLYQHSPNASPCRRPAADQRGNVGGSDSLRPPEGGRLRSTAAAPALLLVDALVSLRNVGLVCFLLL